MARNTRYSPELRERAVTMVVEHRAEYPSEWATMTAVAGMLGMTPETLRNWVRQSGLTTDEKARLKALEKEVRELRRANEILKAASVFFATELDGRTKR